MFDQPYISIMLFIVLCFSGLMVMFFFISRSLEQMIGSLREERSELVGLLRAMDERLAHLVALQQGARRANRLSSARDTAKDARLSDNFDALEALDDDSWLEHVTEEDLALANVPLESGSRPVAPDSVPTLEHTLETMLRTPQEDVESDGHREPLGNDEIRSAASVSPVHIASDIETDIVAEPEYAEHALTSAAQLSRDGDDAEAATNMEDDFVYDEDAVESVRTYEQNPTMEQAETYSHSDQSEQRVSVALGESFEINELQNQDSQSELIHSGEPQDADHEVPLPGFFDDLVSKPASEDRVQNAAISGDSYGQEDDDSEILLDDSMVDQPESQADAESDKMKGGAQSYIADEAEDDDGRKKRRDNITQYIVE